MNFVIYSKDGCSYCEKVKKVLELTGSTFVVYNLGEDFGKKLGGSIETIQFLKEKRVIAS